MSPRISSILLATIVMNALVAVHGWQLAAATAQKASRIAATVTHELAGVLDQRLHKVAEQTAEAATARTVTAIREIVMGELRQELETHLDRAHTRGMIAEAGRAANGNVSPISRRGEV